MVESTIKTISETLMVPLFSDFRHTQRIESTIGSAAPTFTINRAMAF
jgi:hypothetical protein